ncbi:MAG: hypothetical protein ACM3X3_04335 [Betaproteobacteria bacterium]
MANDMEELAARIRKGLQENQGGSLAGILREAGISPERQETLKGLLSGFGYSDSQLFDPVELTRIAHGLLSSMPEQTRRQLVSVILQAVADLSAKDVPAEVKDALSSHADDADAGVPHAEG